MASVECRIRSLLALCENNTLSVMEVKEGHSITEPKSSSDRVQASESLP
jgi:hypothetical protein